VRVAKEREDKFEVDADWVMPQVMRLAPNGGRIDKEVRRLESIYFDTPGEGLRLFGVTLRRCIGGSGMGWQLKVPSDNAPIELQSGSRTTKVPPALARSVEGLLTGESIDPVASVMTTRTVYRVLDADGQLVLEIADDQVESAPPDGGAALRSWREVETELGPAGMKKDLKRARKLLLGAGATPSARTKLDRALGPISSNGHDSVAESGTIGELVSSYLGAQCDVLARNDVGLRTGAPVVHKTRVAARRLRSTLRVFGDVVDSGPAQQLNDELAWYADLLGEVRDREVLYDRLSTLVAELPAEQVRGPVEAEITKTLATEQDNATQLLNDAMRTPRYQHLMQLLRGWKSAPPLTDAAESKGTTGVTYVKEAEHDADRRLRKAGEDIERLHGARKAAKRVRYAAELVEPADSRMKGIARHATDLQTLLGEHQDAVVAADFLATISAASDSGFTYGVLIANELKRAADIRESLRN
jgi:CHAD domain-containing protein